MIEVPVLTLSHWVYLIGIISVIVLMICKREVVYACIIGTFAIGMIHGGGNLIRGTQTVFRAMTTAGSDLFDIMLVIALMVAMLRSLSTMSADKMMIAPAARMIKKPAMAFWIVAGVMYLAASFFWPTPSTALVGTLLIPIAMQAGLKPMAACMAMNIAGHGMALSGDLILQGGPRITAESANIPVENLLPYGAIFATITGLVALIIAFIMNRKDMVPDPAGAVTTASEIGKDAPPFAKYFAVGIPILYLIIVARIVLGSIASTGLSRIIGGGATALLGGSAAMILLISTIATAKGKALEKIIDYLREGFLYSIKIFTPVIPIAGFFLLGSPGSAADILGQGARGLLFDLGNELAAVLPLNAIPLSIGTVIIGGITGLDGSGFSGLPLVGSLSAALATPVGLNVAVIAGLGQVAAVFVGGGTLSAWAFGAVASAGVAGVSAGDLVRKNFIPVISGLGVSTIIAIVILMAS